MSASSRPITLQLENVSLKSALKLLLDRSI